jgi:hypothetical protein
MKFDTTRPSPGRNRGPYVLKMRTIPTSRPSVRWKAAASASERPEHLETTRPRQRLDVFLRAAREVVDAYYRVTPLNKRLA